MNKTQFILQHSEELQEAAENLKQIIKSLRNLEDDSIEADMDKVLGRYDRYIKDIIWNTNPKEDIHTLIDEMVDAAIENEWRNGTEPQFVIQAIDDVFNLLARKGIVKYQEEELQESSWWTRRDNGYKATRFTSALMDTYKSIIKNKGCEIIETVELGKYTSFFTAGTGSKRGGTSYPKKYVIFRIPGKEIINKIIGTNLQEQYFEKTFALYQCTSDSIHMLRGEVYIQPVKKDYRGTYSTDSIYYVPELKPYLKEEGHQDFYLVKTAEDLEKFFNYFTPISVSDEDEIVESVHGSTDEHAIVNAIIESWDDISKSLDRDMILTKQDYGKNSHGILDFTYKFYEESGTTKQINGTITVDFPEFNRGEYKKKNVGPKTTKQIVEMALPSNVSDWLKRAATQSQEQAAKKASRWVEKLGKRIVGGTSIGRSPQTLILDITHHGSQLYINADGEIEFNDQEANDFKSFKKIFDTAFKTTNESVNESLENDDRTEFHELYKKLVPSSGSASTLNGEILRAASRLEYEYWNNGNCNSAEHKYEETPSYWTNDDGDEWVDCEVSSFYMNFINLLRKEVPEAAVELEKIVDIICRNPDTTVGKATRESDDAAYSALTSKVVAHIKNHPEKNVPYEALDED